MDKRYLLTMAAAATVFAACSDDAKELNAPELATNPTEEVAQGQVPVLFDSYVNRATTRAGLTSDITDEVIKANPGSTTWGGFGVFAYYTDNKEYDQLATPNFFYNQLIKYSTDHWTYDPVKYWPNEYGENAISDDADKVSFFAYAPYVEVNPTSGKLTANNNGADDATWGITGMSRNTASGDPIIKYIGSFDNNKSVDLVWGVSNTADWPLVLDGQSQQMEIGKPWLNVERPSQALPVGNTSTQNVKFQFLHALAKMKFTVDAFVDGTDNTNVLADGTKIWIRSVRFTGFAMKGALNLNNETANKPYWMNYNGIGDLESDGEAIVYDGRKDGKEGLLGAEASNEKSLGLNPILVETEESFNAGNWATIGSHYEGVTKTPVPLFATTGIFYAIPIADDDLTVEIVYDVETIDSKLGTKLADNATSGSSIENRILKTIKFGGADSKLEAGKAYEVKLHLGMNDVNFDAAVLPWEKVAPVEADLPANVAFYKAEATGTGEATIPYNATSYLFGINNLNGGEVINAELVATGSYSNTATGTKTNDTSLANWSVVATTNANASGYQVEKLTTEANTLTTNRVQMAKWTGATSGNKVTMTFTQLAAPLALQEPASKVVAATSPYEYQLRRTGANYGFFCTGIDAATFAAPLTTNGDPETGANGIKVWRNGNKLNYVTVLTNNGDFTFDDSGKITVQENFAVGDVIKVVLKTGDAPAETITWTVE